MTENIGIAESKDALLGANDTLVAQVSSLRGQVDSLQNQLNASRRALEDFKKRVGAKALELAREHDWCEVVGEALEELGIPIPPQRFAISLSVDLTIEASTEKFNVDEDFVRESLDFARDGAIRLDNDWSRVEVADVGRYDYRISSIEPVE